MNCKKYIFLALLNVVGCSTLVVTPERQNNLTLEDALSAWSRVLKNYVDGEGRVNFVGVSKKRSDLDLYVGFVTEVGPRTYPELFPTSDARIAHFINSYNALSLFNILDAEIPESLSGFKKVKFFYFKKFKIDGEEMSLYQYENNIIRKQGEERVHFALNCMSRGCPRLPKDPFTTQGLQNELNAEAKQFFNEDRNVRVNSEEQIVYLSQILDFFPEDFLAKAPSLNSYANRYRNPDMKFPENFKTKFIPYDWTVNSQ